jgi:hypothetical protein
MDREAKLLFLLLVLAQAAHSIEECSSKLYDVFAPARFVGGLISRNTALGFAIGNAVLVAFGLWCWAVPVRRGWPSVRWFAWFWTILEVGNGISHTAMALSRRAYFRASPRLRCYYCWPCGWWFF